MDICQENSSVIIYTSIQDKKLIVLKKDGQLNNRFGHFLHNNIIGQPYGSKILNVKGDHFVYVLRPSAQLITDTLAHKTQILYSTDISLVIMKLNIVPGSIVVESGTGSCSLSCSIIKALQRNGHLFTFEFNQERAENANQVFLGQGLQEFVTVTHRDVINEGFTIENQPFEADSVFLDLPKPYEALKHAKQVLKQGGKVCCFSPCIEQVMKNCEEMNALGFGLIETVEALGRNFEQKPKQFKSAFEVNSTNVKRDINGAPIKENLFSNGQQFQKGHTAYLNFAVLVQK